MFIAGESLIYSASDLTLAQECEFALLSKLDEKLGLRKRLRVEDPFLERAARLGDEHEARVLAGYRRQFGDSVVEIIPPSRYDLPHLREHAEASLAALRDGAAVVFQAGFFDGRFHGRSDFLVREEGTGGRADLSPRYAVVDTKLARTAKASAVLQLAAYADQLVRCDIPIAPTTRIHMGDGRISEHSAAASMAVLRQHRAHVESLLDSHREAGVAVQWGDPAISACLECDYCREAMAASRDVMEIFGVDSATRRRLRAAGLATIDDFAAAEHPVPTVKPRLWKQLQAQAGLQLRAESDPEGSALYEVIYPEGFASLPESAEGDFALVVHKDPLWSDGSHKAWGLIEEIALSPATEHGTAEEEPASGGAAEHRVAEEGAQSSVSVGTRATTLAEEERLLRRLIDTLTSRLNRSGGWHVFHFGQRPLAQLQQAATRHGLDQQWQQLRQARLFTDLQRVLTRSILTSVVPESVTALAPLFSSGEKSEVGHAVTSHSESDEENGSVADGGAAAEEESAAEAEASLLFELRDWLGKQNPAQPLPGLASAPMQSSAVAPPSGPGAAGAGSEELHPPEEPVLSEEQQRTAQLLASLRRMGDDSVGPLLAAALEYFHHENEPYWREHFDRLRSDTAIGDIRDVLDVFHARKRLVTTDDGRTDIVLELAGRFGTGSTIEAGSRIFTVYDPPQPGTDMPPDCRRGVARGTVLFRDVSKTGLDRVRVRESAPRSLRAGSALPILLTPGPPPPTHALEGAIEKIARQVIASGDSVDGAGAGLGAAALDIAARRPPRLSTPSTTDPEDSERDETAASTLPPRAGLDADGTKDAAIAALRSMSDSYLAIQGPPGTGKTYLGAQLITELAREHSWKIGVVASSHTVVEHLLEGVIAAGLDPKQVAKRGQKRSSSTFAGARRTDVGNVAANAPETPWTELDTYGHQQFLQTNRTRGAVIGGTAWDFANRKRFSESELDLLVIDEAGQFSLTHTFATATSARRLLLLGDPQQLPQVSQGSHEVPVNLSALGWLTGNHATLPPECGYLLQVTRRMHPQLCAPISRLFYDGRLSSHRCTSEREASAIAAGLHQVKVSHEMRTVDSPEEAAEVIEQIKALLGTPWRGDDGTRTLTPPDFLIVAAYNAQVQRIQRGLEEAGLTGARVGTVDKFQGQQAPIVLVSLAASSALTTPRGLDFLLSPNRLNVAISRAQWAAILVHSPQLSRILPADAAGLTALGGFIELCDEANDRSALTQPAIQLANSE